MKLTTEATQEAWLSGDYTGEQRPMMRATISQWHMYDRPYLQRWTSTSQWRHNGHYRSCLFNGLHRIRELRNIKSIKWSRGVDTDVATMTIVLVNVHWLPDVANPNEEEFDFPGWFTPSRGDDDRWDYASNGWADWLLPDRMIHTYEGYGVDFDEIPEDDPNMYPSGVWLIDDVTFGADGLITIECRDIGRLLLEQMLFPPIVPGEIAPLWFSKFEEVDAGTHWVPTGDWTKPDWESDSNDYVRDAGLMDGTRVAVNATTGKVYGHEGPDATDADASTYWLSAGSADPNQLEWIQFDLGGEETVSGIRLNVKGGPYKAYVSLYHADRGWLGGGKIKYEVADDGVDNEADIKFVKQFYMAAGETDDFQLPRIFHRITKIRLTFAPRWNSGIGQDRVYRVALQEFAYADELVREDLPGMKTLGNYGDYTDIVKWLLSWSGLWWPGNGKLKVLGGEIRDFAPAEEDDVLVKGAVWGDLENTGLSGIAKLDVDVFDKKPVMDGISAVRDIVGFNFWIDETGGAIWRMPNVWKRGNYLAPDPDEPRTRTTEVLEIDERTTLMELSVKKSSRNVRERIIVSDVNGNFGRVVAGYNPVPTGQWRVAGWSDQHFRNRAEATKMADLIAIRQAFLYQQNTVTIAGNPAIQVDDQVVIYERMTGESGLHRVLRIDSEFDFEDGKWTYQLTTHWLGDAAFTERAWEPPRIDQNTKFWLNEMGWRA